MDYKKLDDILDFLRKSQGYIGWQNYANYVKSRDNLIADTINNENAYAGWGNTLLNWGLVDYQFSGNKKHMYIINPKGLELLNNGISTRDFHNNFKRRENLEDKILQQTNESYRLNNVQFIITLILALGTIGSLLIQWRTFEMEKVKTELEIRDLKSRLDSIQKPILKNNKD